MWIHTKEWEESWGEEKYTDTDKRWFGPVTTAFPANVIWEISGEEDKLGGMTIKKLTRSRAFAKSKPPPGILAWENRIGGVKREKVFRLKSFYTTPRDQATWMKLIHRNLFVASRDPTAQDQTCKARGCTVDESMLHLATCGIIRHGFWSKLEGLLDRLDIPRGTGRRFWIVGERNDGKYADIEGAGIIFLAWRCLYASTVQARIENKELNLKHAYARVVQMIISRLKAEGQKWFRWRTKITNIRENKAKTFPKRYQKRKLLTTDKEAQYTLNPVLYREFGRIANDL